MAVASYLHDGCTVQYTPSGSDVSAGDVIDLGDFVGVAVTDIDDGTQGTLQIKGAFRVTKKTGESWTQGDPVYYDAGTTSFSSNVSYSEAVAGLCIADAATGDSTGDIVLTPGVARS